MPTKSHSILATNAANTLEAIGNLRVKSGTRYNNAYEMPESAKKYAKFAQAAYDPDATTVSGYKRDEQLSTPQFSVYTKGKKLVYAVRGSKELYNDFIVNDLGGIAIGQDHKQLGEARAKYLEIQKKYPGYTKKVTGHSLGGLTSAVIGAENNLTTWAYNPGSSPLGGQRYQDFLATSFGNENVNTVIAEGDAVSMGAVKHATNMHVIRNTQGLKSTVDRHLMHNFITKKPLEAIKKHLEKTGVPTRDVIEKLKGKSDASLNKRLVKLVGGGNMAVNEGEYLGSGGFHAQYKPQNNLISINGEQVPGPGAKIYINKSKNLLYVFDDDHKPHLLMGTADQKSAALKKYAKNYNEGPTLLVDDSSGSPPTRQVAMVSAHGGRGIEPVSATSVDDWKTVLGGLNRHGSGGGWWSGKKSKFGHVGNGLVDPFQMPEGTIDDGHADRLDSIGEWLGHNSVMLAMTGTEFILDEVTGGAASVAMTVIDSLSSAATGTTLAGMAQAEVDKLIPDVRHGTMQTITNLFANAKTVGTKAYASHDNVLLQDDRIPYRQDKLKTAWSILQKKATKVGLNKSEKQRMAALNPKTADKRTQRQQSAELDRLEPKYHHMSQAFESVARIKKYDHKAKKLGMSAVTGETYGRMRGDMIPGVKSGIQSTVNADEWKTQIDAVALHLNNSIDYKLKNAGEIYTHEREKQSKFDATASILTTIAPKKDFEAVYKGTGSWTSEAKLGAWHNFKRERWESFQHARGQFDAFDIGQLYGGDKYFVERHLKDHPIADVNFTDLEHFSKEPEVVTKAVDLIHEHQHQILEEASAKDATKMKPL